MRLAFAFALLLGLSGCRDPLILGPRVAVVEFVVRVESDTEWTGLVNGVGVSGFGERAFPITGGCWVFTKRTVDGLIRAYAMPANVSSRQAGVPKFGDKATTSAFGTVPGCLS